VVALITFIRLLVRMRALMSLSSVLISRDQEETRARTLGYLQMLQSREQSLTNAALEALVFALLLARVRGLPSPQHGGQVGLSVLMLRWRQKAWERWR